MKEAFGCILIATGLDKNIDYIPVLVNCAPEILSLTPDSHEEFVQMPSITQAALSLLECPGVLGAELLTPLPGEFRICCHLRPRVQDELSQSFDFPIFKRSNQIQTGRFRGERVSLTH